MNKDDSLKNFQELLRLRALLKEVSQITWNISVLEKRYPLEGLTGIEVDELVKTYKKYLSQLKKAVA